MKGFRSSNLNELKPEGKCLLRETIAPARSNRYPKFTLVPHFDPITEYFK